MAKSIFLWLLLVGSIAGILQMIDCKKLSQTGTWAGSSSIWKCDDDSACEEVCEKKRMDDEFVAKYSCGNYGKCDCRFVTRIREERGDITVDLANSPPNGRPVVYSKGVQSFSKY